MKRRFAARPNFEDCYLASSPHDRRNFAASFSISDRSVSRSKKNQNTGRSHWPSCQDAGPVTTRISSSPACTVTMEPQGRQRSLGESPFLSGTEHGPVPGP